MAKATVGAGGIEYIQGALSKPKKQNGHKHGNYVIMTHRSAPSTNPECQRIYSRPADAYERTAPVTADEQAARTRFAAIATMVAQRKKNASTLPTDIANFNAQKNLANGKKTLQSYLWAECATVYDNDGGH